MTITDNSFWFNTFEEHGSSILAFLTSRVGRRDLAEDLLQETFVRAMRRRLSDEGNVRSYLFTTAHRLILDHHRKKKPALFSEITPEDGPGMEAVADDEAASAEETTDLRLLEDRLGGVLEALPPAHRVAFESAVLNQQTYAEIAEQQGWSLEKVKTNVHRARKKVIDRLRPMMSPHAES